MTGVNAVVILLISLAAAPPAASPLPARLGPGDHVRTVAVGGGARTRSYRIHVPPGQDRTPWPVVLAFHGAASNPEAQERYSGLSAKADEAGFLAVYPGGSCAVMAPVLTWNAGICCGYASSHAVDDVAFTRAVIDDLERVLPIDPRRIYATGLSNGAMMVHRLGCELSDRIAAIAPVAGAMAFAACAPARPVPVIEFHGTEDAFVPFAGGRSRRLVGLQVQFAAVEDSVRGWAQRNGCGDAPVKERLPERVADGTSVERSTYASGCRDGAEVVLLRIEGAGHTWPGQPPRNRFLGKSTGNVSANDAMWEFFQRHPLPAPESGR